MKEKYKFWVVVSPLIVLLLLAFVIGLIGGEEIHYEAPCVDGDGDVNLAGIMCDKMEYTQFGMNQGVFMGIMLILMVIAFILILRIAKWMDTQDGGAN